MEDKAPPSLPDYQVIFNTDSVKRLTYLEIFYRGPRPETALELCRRESLTAGSPKSGGVKSEQDCPDVCTREYSDSPGDVGLST